MAPELALLATAWVVGYTWAQFASPRVVVEGAVEMEGAMVEEGDWEGVAEVKEPVLIEEGVME